MWHGSLTIDGPALYLWYLEDINILAGAITQFVMFQNSKKIKIFQNISIILSDFFEIYFLKIAAPFLWSSKKVEYVP